jgi:putative hydrolase of the HAD superfamily
MLLDIPEARVRLLEKLANHYRVFILSNSNEIHYLKYAADFKVKYGYHDFDELVEKAYFSFRLHLQKPGKEIFEFVIFDRGLNPGETLFIDDSVMHIEGAKKAGLIAYQLRIAEGEQLTDLFTKE